VEVPKVGFNEALQRIAKFDRRKLSDNLKQKIAKKEPYCIKEVVQGISLLLVN
jgi:hypothetical protein